MNIKKYLEGELSFTESVKISNIIFEQDGIGSISRNKNPDLTLWTSPILYLKSVLDFQPNQDSIDFLIESIESGKPIAPPTLKLVWLEDLNVWWVRGHEGRHRMKVIEIIESGATEVPCSVETKKGTKDDKRFGKLSQSNITATMIEELDNKVISERTGKRQLDDDLLRREVDITDRIEKGNI